jgi:hypothetical protein
MWEAEFLEANNVIALAAAVVSLSAMLVAVWQGSETRRHNRMSVRPRIRFDLVRQGERVQFYMANTGTGPAIIERFMVYRDKEPLISLTVKKLTEEFAGLGLRGSFFLWYPHKGDALAAGEKPNVITAELEDDADSKWAILKNQLERLTVFCEYSSIYGEKRSVDVNALGVPLALVA